MSIHAPNDLRVPSFSVRWDSSPINHVTALGSRGAPFIPYSSIGFYALASGATAGNGLARTGYYPSITPMSNGYAVVVVDYQFSATASPLTARFNGVVMNPIVVSGAVGTPYIGAYGLPIGNLGTGVYSFAAEVSAFASTLNPSLLLFSGVDQVNPTGAQSGLTNAFLATRSLDLSGTTGNMIISVNNHSSSTIQSVGSNQVLVYDSGKRGMSYKISTPVSTITSFTLAAASNHNMLGFVLQHV